MTTKKKTKKTSKKIDIEQLQREIVELRYGMKMMIDLIEGLQKTVDQLRPSIFRIGQIPDDHVKYEQFRLNQKQIIPCQHRYPQVWMGVGPAPCELCGQLGPEPVKASLQTTGTCLDNETIRRRETLTKMQTMTSKELFGVAVRAGIYTETGELTPPYQDTNESIYRPKD